MQKSAKRAVLLILKWLGLFHFARLAMRRGLRILCYHGFALSDESDFRPKLFMRPETFEKRMGYLSSHGYVVLSLERACNDLATKSLPNDAVAITIDDGFYSVFRCAWPVLQELSFPATTYVTSYYAQKQNPVFRLVVQYMFWKTKKGKIDGTALGLSLSDAISLQSQEQKDRAMWEIISFGENHLGELERSILAEELGRRLGVDYGALRATRNLSLMNSEEIRTLALAGSGIQLHTHRHRLPETETLVYQEIRQNRDFLEPLVGRKLQHFCYPSGVWSKRHWPWLQALGITTATTCDSGLNYPQTPRLALRRFLDGEDVSQIEFEAELCGLSDFLRSVRSFLGGSENTPNGQGE
jgi:peptidoglycan/xylan/chitin deacetylase (PgdA/CDA1 family)